MIQNNKKDYIFSPFQNFILEGAVCDKKENSVTSTPIAQMKIQDTLDIKNKKKKKILFGSTIASTILTAAVLGVIFTRGLHGSSVSRWVAKLSADIAELEKTKSTGLTRFVTYHTKKAAKRIVSSLQAIANFTAIKDWSSDKILCTNKVTGAFADKSKHTFKKVADKALDKQYQTAENGVRNFSSTVKEFVVQNLHSLPEGDRKNPVTIKGVTKTLQEWMDLLVSYSTQMEQVYDKNFSVGARKMRDQKRSGMVRGLSKKIQERFFSSPKALFKKETFSTYATEDITSASKAILQKEILDGKRQLTNNISSISEGIKVATGALDAIIRPEDTTSAQLVSTIKSKIKDFADCSGSEELRLREVVSSEITSLLETLKTTVLNNRAYSKGEKASVSALLKQITDTVTSTSTSNGSKGALEEVLTIINGLHSQTNARTGHKFISDTCFNELNKISKKINKFLTKATELEAGEYFSKIAELEVGSAAPDVISLFAPVGVAAYAIGKADSKEQKVSTTLTLGIPLIGSFATAIYGTTKMLSGTTNLAFSLITGALLSQVGKSCDELYKKYKKSGSIAKVAKEEYDKMMVGFEGQENKTKQLSDVSNKK